jgi:hypothetical protein
MLPTNLRFCQRSCSAGAATSRRAASLSCRLPTIFPSHQLCPTISALFRRPGVTAAPCTLYTRLRDRYFIFGGSLMDSTVPADLLSAPLGSWLDSVFSSVKPYSQRRTIPLGKSNELWLTGARIRRSRRPRCRAIGWYTFALLHSFILESGFGKTVWALLSFWCKRRGGVRTGVSVTSGKNHTVSQTVL